MSEPRSDGGALGALGKALLKLVEPIKDPTLAAVLAVLVVVAIVVVFAFAGSTAGLALLVVVAVVTSTLIVLMRLAGHVERAPVPGATIELAARLRPDDRFSIQRTLAQAATETADVLGVPVADVRANVFGLVADGRLAMLPDLSFHMSRPEEQTLHLTVGQGATGLSYASGQPYIAVLHADWGDAVIPDDDLAKLDPALRWIVSIPVYGGEPEPRPVWVLNLDGLRARPTVSQLQAIVGRTVRYAQLIALLLARAGERELA